MFCRKSLFIKIPYLPRIIAAKNASSSLLRSTLKVVKAYEALTTISCWLGQLLGRFWIHVPIIANGNPLTETIVLKENVSHFQI